MTHAPPSEPIAAIIANINRLATSDETLDDVLAIGKNLVKLFAYGKLEGLIHLSNKSYLSPELKPSYSWVRRLMKMAVNPKVVDPLNRRHLPSPRTALVEISLMKDSRFQQGIKPDPENNEVIAITPSTSREDLRMYRISAEDPTPPAPAQYLFIIIPKKDELDSVIDTVRELALSNRCGS